MPTDCPIKNFPVYFKAARVNFFHSPPPAWTWGRTVDVLSVLKHLSPCRSSAHESLKYCNPEGPATHAGTIERTGRQAQAALGLLLGKHTAAGYDPRPST